MKNVQRLIVEIPEILHRQIRLEAADKNMSIKDCVMNALIMYLEQQKDLKPKEK